MIVSKNKSLPTQFAIMVAQHHGLFVPPEQEPGNEALWFDLKDRLANFQKMAMSCSFDDCLIAYYGIDLEEEQKTILEFIHSKTKSWMVGHISENLMDHLQSKNVTGRDAKEIAQALVELLKTNGKQTTQKTKSMLVRFANLPPDVRINLSDGEEAQAT